jgi:hypothetical protein
MKIQASESSFQEAGISDIVGCYHGLFVAIEVKQPGGKVSPIQERFLASVDENGGYTCVAESTFDVVDFIKKVDAARRRADEAKPQSSTPHGRRSHTVAHRDG